VPESEPHVLLENNVIAPRWRELLSISTQIDVAVAWITSESLTDDLLRFASLKGKRVRVISGYRDFLTNPEALRRLHAANLVKMGFADSGSTYHPKVYLFTTDSESLCWVGSANLTDAGFGRNVEIVHEFSDDGGARAWIDGEWLRFGFPTTEWLDQYEQRWKECQQRNRALPAAAPLAPPEKPSLPSSLIVELRPGVSGAVLEDFLLKARNSIQIATAPDFKRLHADLIESDNRAISVQSFLWLVGWCNTGGPCAAASNDHIKPLVLQMFGYIAPQFLQVGSNFVNLKRYRYRHPPPAVTQAVVDFHRAKLTE
jgi:phosphatidylserine/phosphatidylglycerophosphate/cardiolipin synthase-like enzyme